MLKKWTNWILPIAIVLILAGRYIYFMPRLDSGETAPAFSATLPDGSPFQLDQLRGRYVLMHFWGSWCGPCRSENPQLVAMYQRFGGARFEIVSVGIEKDPARWERARGQDGLSWPWQLVEITPSLRFFDSPIANQFSVKKLPTLFLLNPEGEIVLVDVSVEKLTQYLEGKLK